MIDEKKLIEEITTFGERMTNNGMQGDFHIKIIKAIIDIIANQVKVGEWIPCSERLPEDCEEIVLVQVSGKPADNILFDNAFELALYKKEEGWILDNYPEWKNPEVIAWQPLPEPYKPKKTIPVAGMDHIMSRFTKVK